MIDLRYEDSELTSRVIGCAMAVHNELGNGFQEVIYQRSIAFELEDAGINFAREVDMQIFYKGRFVGMRRVDFLIEGRLSVELKAIIQLEKVHLAQAMNYLEAYNLKIGLLINFGATSLDFKRLTNPKHRIITPQSQKSQ